MMPDGAATTTVCERSDLSSAALEAAMEMVEQTTPVGREPNTDRELLNSNLKLTQ